jgi:hypothetical protein
VPAVGGGDARGEVEAKQVVNANLPTGMPSVHALCLSHLVGVRSDRRARAAAAQLCDRLQALDLRAALCNLVGQVASWATVVHPLKSIRQRPNPLGDCGSDGTGVARLGTATEPARLASNIK